METSVRYFSWLENYLAKEGVKDQCVWRALRKASRPYRHPILYPIWSGCQDQAKALRFYLITLWRGVTKKKRALLGNSTGSIRANPNLIILVDPFSERFPIGITRLSWASSGTVSVEVHVDAPDGPLLTRTGPSGNTVTGKWVHDRMAFYLQEVSKGKPLTAAHTLDVVHVKVAVARPTRERHPRSV